MTVQFLFCFPGGLNGKESACNAGDPGSIPRLGRSPGEGHGNPLRYSCLESSMDRGAWWAIVHGATKSRTQLSDFQLLLSGFCLFVFLVFSTQMVSFVSFFTLFYLYLSMVSVQSTCNTDIQYYMLQVYNIVVHKFLRLSFIVIMKYWLYSLCCAIYPCSLCCI